MPKSLFFLVLLLPLASLAQSNDASQKIIAKFTAYSASHPGEKVYLQFDRPYYAAGDTIFYKAYLTIPGTHELSALSGVLHVELLDKLAGKTLFTEKLKITNGVAWGDFALPDTLTNSSYTIRAYTNLMRNNGEADFFTQEIPVVKVKALKNGAASTATAKAVIPAASPLKPAISFFPEGGTIVAGITVKVAFKAINTNGMGIAVKGVVHDNDDKQVCSFTSAHLGMGAFTFKPEQGKSYKADVTYANGIQDAIDLPGIMSDGITLSAVNDSMLVIPVTLNASAGYLKANKGRIFILSVYSGGVLTNIPCPLDSLSLQAYFYKKKLHTGITRLTLFSPDGEPLCERLLFVNNNDQLKIGIGSDAPAYGKRQKVTIHINASDIKGLPVQGDLSVAVTDETKAPADTDAENTIVNYLLLSSELKGHIEQPNYYFNRKTAAAQSDLDNLMLTQGYRSFEWKTILNNADTTAQYTAEKQLSLKGIVTDLHDKPVSGADISLGSIKEFIARDTTANANGEFSFNDLFIVDTARLLLRAGKGNKNWKADVSKDDMPAIIRTSLQDTSASAVKPQIAEAMRKEYIQYGNMRTGIMLKEVKINEDKNPEHIVPLLHSDNLNGAGRADQVIMGDQLVGCAQVADCLASLMRGVKIVYGGVPVRPIFTNIRTASELMGKTKAMAISLNGVIMGQMALDDISTDDIYSIEVLRDPMYLSIYGSRATGGLLVITTKNGTEPRLINIQPGLTTYLFHGFYKSKAFYSPVYDVKTPAGDKPDIRTTLCWKPVLLTDKEGNASFDFYTADNPGKYRVVVEGIGSDGGLGRAVYECTVK